MFSFSSSSKQAQVPLPSASAAPTEPPRQRVAVIGGGVTGLAAAWHLHVNCGDRFEVHVLEAADRLGGHAYTTTVPATPDDDNDDDDKSKEGIDVDIGFMVFNHENYPNLVKWFQALQIQQEDSDMSLSVSLDGGNSVEWSSNGLNGLWANRSNLFNLHFRFFLQEMVRFNAQAVELLRLSDDDPRKHVTTGEFLRRNGYSTGFCHYYLLPMMAALWSASMPQVLDFPAVQLISFLCNHKMLQLFGRPQWKTVAGRSKQYTQRMADILGPQAHLNTPIDKVTRVNHESDDKPPQYRLTTTSGTDVEGTFQHVIFACHAPTAHDILRKGNAVAVDTNADASSALLDLLSQIQYADNVVYVHSDPALMPKRQRAWASWNCIGRSKYLPSIHRPFWTRMQALEGADSGFGNKLQDKNDNVNDDSSQKQQQQHLEGPDGRMKAVYVTYWLNKLQNLKTKQNIFVSLNPHQVPATHLTHHRVILAHPQFTTDTLQARKTLQEEFQGRNNLWFCGAWQGYGFHEDGCRAGFQVATQISQTPLPWARSPKQPVLEPPNLAYDKDDKHIDFNLKEFAWYQIWWTWLCPRPVVEPPNLLFSKDGKHIDNRARILKKHLKEFAWYQKWWTWLCRRFVVGFLKGAIRHGRLVLVHNNDDDGGGESRIVIGDGTPCGCDDEAVTIRVFDPWFYARVAWGYDLGLARSYMAGEFVVLPLDDVKSYHPVIRPPTARNEATTILGDPVGLTRLFLLLIGNRDAVKKHVPRKSALGYFYLNALTNGWGLFISVIGRGINFLRYQCTMENDEFGGSRANIRAHYDLSNDLFRTFLDKETLMYSSAIYDAVRAPAPLDGLVFRGTLEQAQWRKLDTLLARAQVQPGQKLLDIGFGWGKCSFVLFVVILLPLPLSKKLTRVCLWCFSQRWIVSPRREKVRMSSHGHYALGGAKSACRRARPGTRLTRSHYL